MIKQIEHVDLSDKVYEILKEMIFKREFEGGQKLDLNYLSTEMNISRTPLKDALQQLENDGLVEILPRRGTYVKKVSEKDIAEMMEMRLMMELWAVDHFTKQQAKEAAQQLKKITGEANNLIADSFDYNDFLELDFKFHKTLLVKYQNERLTASYLSMNISFQIARVFYFKNYERSINSQQEHVEIVKALEKYDLNLARKALKNHLKTSGKIMMEILKKNGGEV